MCAADTSPGNTRVISQTALAHFRDALGTKQHDPFAVVLKQNKLPMSLLEESKKVRSALVTRTCSAASPAHELCRSLASD